MPLMLFLIGAPRAGKTAVFDALTNTPQGPHCFVKGAHRLGTVKVPDTRLEGLRDLYNPKKFTPAEVTFVDVALPPATAGESNSFSQLNAFLGDADAFAIVVQAFGEMDYQGQTPDPAKQLESLLLELIVADMEKVEKRIEKIDQELKRGIKGNEAERAVLERCKAQLDAGKALRDLEFSVEDDKRISSFRFLTQRRALVIANVGEGGLDGKGLEPLRTAAAGHQLEVLVFCAPLEAEIATLDAEAQASFLKDYGIAEPARVRLVQAAYRLLELISFFTVGPDEVRAWTIRRGTVAPQAAGKVHSDIERGFIRAETVQWEPLLRLKSHALCREQALLRLEGKQYVVQDGDVIDFRFNA